MYSLCFDFPKLRNIEMFFQKQHFYNIWMKGKKQTWQPLIAQTGRAMKKIVLKQGEAWTKPGDFT